MSDHSVSPVTGACAALTLCLAIAGVNLPNPLAPLYTARFGLTPLLQSVLFSVYLAALVLTLAVTVSAPHRRRSGPRTSAADIRTLVTALALGVGADLVMLAGSVSFPVLLAGRALAGVAAGLATGSAAAVALAGLGEAARTVAAGAAVVGALSATVGGGVVATLVTPDTASFTVVYLGHAGIAALLTTALVLSARPAQAAPPAGHAPGRTPGTGRVTPTVRVTGGYRRRHRVAGYLIGVMSWTSAGIVLALVASQLRQTTPGISALGAMTPGAVFLAVSWAGQLLVNRRILRLRAWQTALPLVAGLAGLGPALASGHLAGVLLAAAVCGLGQGPCYSLGLATVTYALSPAQQGRASSVYAAVAYGACGVLTVAAGLSATAVGVAETFGIVAVVCTVGGVAATLLAGPAQQLRVVAAAPLRQPVCA